MARNYVMVNNAPYKKIYIGSTKLTRIYANNVLVYQRTPDVLFPVNDDNRDVVGGYDVVAIEHLDNGWGYFYGADAGDSFASDNQILLYNPGSCSVRTRNRINFDEHKYTSITITADLQISGWGYDDYKFDNNNTYAKVFVGFTADMYVGAPILTTNEMYSNGNPPLPGYSGNIGSLKPDYPQRISITLYASRGEIPQSGSYYLYINDWRQGVGGRVHLNIISITATV